MLCWISSTEISRAQVYAARMCILQQECGVWGYPIIRNEYIR